MRIVFISNYLSHHQRPFCDRLFEALNKGFAFIATQPIGQERIAMGWQEELPEYVLCAYSDAAHEALAKQMAFEADVAIIGSAPDAYIIPRLKAGKLTFKYSERFYKQGLSWKNFAHAAAGAWLHHGRFQKYPLYMLCASAFTPYDCSVFGNYKNRTYRWGYFPAVKTENVEDIFAKRRAKGRRSLLWAGRFLELKHPEATILLAEELKRDGYAFELTIIGSGKMEQALRQMVNEKQLNGCVHMLGSMKPDQVREYMEASDIFLFTSDFNEGWGAVLNEAMNSACAVVASHAIGSVPYLVQNEKNGLIYRNGDQQSLSEAVRVLLDDPNVCEFYGRNAYRTITEVWNADTAAQRFLKFVEEVQERGVCELYPDGPCSRSPIIKNGWFI